MVGMALVLGLAIGTPCDLSKSARVGPLLEAVAEDQRLPLASAWLAEACSLSAPLQEALEGVGRVSPSQAPLLAMQAAAAEPQLLLRACTGGPRTLAAFAAAEPASARAVLFDGCGLQRHRAVDRAGFLAASRGSPVLYLLVAEAVAAVAADPGLRESLRALAGLPSPRAPKPPVVPFRW